MANPEVVEVRKRIDAERTRLDEHLTSLKGELRSAVPFVAAGVVTVAALAVALVIARRGKRKARSFTITWKFT